MKIALFLTAHPFIYGGAELLAEDLQMQLKKAGHITHCFRIPFIMEFETGIFLNALSVKMLCFDDYDVFIAFKYPCWAVSHKNKRIWLLHQFRQVYDMWNKPYGIADNEIGRGIRVLVEDSDKAGFAETKKIFAISNAAKRLEKYTGIYAEIMRCPLKNLELYHFDSIGDYIYYPSRVDPWKRQLLAVEAMKYTRSGVKLFIDGKASDWDYINRIYTTVDKYKLKERVFISDTFVSEEDKIDKYAKCLASVYLPQDEDSEGFITQESFYSRKPVVTISDSGGVADFLIDGENGYIVEPSPQAIAEKFDYLFEHKDIARSMGENAYNYIMAKNINWEETIRRLLA